MFYFICLSLFLIAQSTHIYTMDTNLKKAIIKSDTDTVKILLKAKPNLNLEDQYFLTALHYAAQNNEKNDIAIILIENGASPNKKDTLGLTPAHYAIRKYNYSILKVLLPTLDQTIQNSWGDTIFHRIAEADPKSFQCWNVIIKSMVEKKTLAIKNQYKETAYDICIRKANNTSTDKKLYLTQANIFDPN